MVVVYAFAVAAGATFTTLGLLIPAMVAVALAIGILVQG